jgi:carbamoyl-phosphate synthase large subunit
MIGNILILSAGRRVSLVKAFQEEVAKALVEVEIFAADANPVLSSACCVADSHFTIPRIDAPEYITYLKILCIEKNVRVVVPTIDTELLILSKNKDDFESSNIFILSPDFDFVSMCRDKRLTQSYFTSLGINVAKEFDKSNFNYPVFVKPKDGSSSQHLYIAHNADELPPFVLKHDRFMLLEYLNPKEHTEFTCDLYYSKIGKLSCVVPRKRIETRGGEVSKGLTQKNFLVDFIFDRFAQIAGARGCVTMQFFVHNSSNKVYGIEINPRFGGGYPLSYLAGANFPGWIINEYLLSSTVERFNDWENNLLMLRFDDEILIHDFNT